MPKLPLHGKVFSYQKLPELLIICLFFFLLKGLDIFPGQQHWPENAYRLWRKGNFLINPSSSWPKQTNIEVCLTPTLNSHVVINLFLWLLFEQSSLCQSSQHVPGSSGRAWVWHVLWNKAHPAMGQRFSSSLEKHGYIPSFGLVFHWKGSSSINNNNTTNTATKVVIKFSLQVTLK